MRAVIFIAYLFLANPCDSPLVLSMVSYLGGHYRDSQGWKGELFVDVSLIVLVIILAIILEIKKDHHKR